MKNYLIIVTFLFVACNNPKKTSLSEENAISEVSNEIVSESNNLLPEENNIIDDISQISETPRLENADEYFRLNNKCNNWDKNNPKQVAIKAVVSQDSTTSNIKVLKSSNNEMLDKEAIRLIKIAKVSPGKNLSGKVVKTNFVICISFPSK